MFGSRMSARPTRRRLVALLAGIAFLAGLGLGLPYGPPAAASDSVARAADRPTVTTVKRVKNRLVFRFVAPAGPYTFYQVRWSRPGRDEVQEKIGLGYGESQFTIPEVPRPNTVYTFKVQAGYKRPLSSSTCTPWAELRFRTRK